MLARHQAPISRNNLSLRPLQTNSLRAVQEIIPRGSNRFPALVVGGCTKGLGMGVVEAVERSGRFYIMSMYEDAGTCMSGGA